MRISEIFSSIQGESTYAGRPCSFVRTTGCDQRCTWCDTAYAFHGGEEMSLDDLYAAVTACGNELVEVTGGEPLLQPEVPEFTKELCDRGYTVLIETGGSLPIAGLDPRVRRILDLKAPASGMTTRVHWDNLHHLKAGDEIKFVLADRSDFDWAAKVMANHRLTERTTVLFAPVFGVLEPRLLAEWILADRLPVRLQLQLHKYIWSPTARGV
ncbi:MAG: 7-carboxy-7-deazaguanine synthase QueE [Nitrospirota bacterium]|nr:7-carboxy-7-deazaguanine synthase QueE [Nitrospirota bacterium]